MSQPDPKDRRKSPRITCDFQAELYVLFPEETFRPHPFMVRVADASALGCKVVCKHLSEAQFSMMQTSVRFARLVVRGDKRIAKTYCRIVWIAQRADNPAVRTFELGLAYDPRDQETAEDPGFILQRARETEAAEGGSAPPLPAE